MKQELMNFDFKGKQVRTTTDENKEIWFVAKDVAEVLGYATAKDLTRRLDEDEKGGRLVPTLGGTQELTTISESGLYCAILSSRKPEAKAFKKWVTSEVLPEIRKNGGYLMASKEETAEEVMARAVLVAQATIERQKKALAEAEVKVKLQQVKVVQERKAKEDEQKKNLYLNEVILTR